MLLTAHSNRRVVFTQVIFSALIKSQATKTGSSNHRVWHLELYLLAFSEHSTFGILPRSVM